MKGGTGVFIDNKNMQENFMLFLQNSDFTFVGKGAYGITFRATISPTSTYVSPYKNIDYTGYDTPVTSLLIKISALEYKSTTPMSKIFSIVNPVDEEDFKKEVNIQTETFLKTMNYLQPICPAIVYSNIFNNSDKSVLNIIRDKLIIHPDKDKDEDEDEDEEEYVKDLMADFIKYIKRYGVIGMELLNNYQTLHSLRKTSDYGLYRVMLIYLLVEFAVKFGYTHADFHASNIMVNPSDTNFFKGYKGSIILIDFGLAKKIPLNLLQQIKDLFQDKTQPNRYEKIIKILCSIPNTSTSGDDIDLRRHTNYDIVCKYKPNDSQIDKLFVAKQKATNDIVQEFNSKTDRTKFPLLPLSNTIKNKMFPGLIPEETIPTEIVHLNIPSNIKVKYDTVIDKICDFLDESLKSIEQTKNMSNSEKSLLYINSCYNANYLITRRENIDVDSNYMLQPSAGMFCAGLNEKYDYRIDKYKRIYQVYEIFCNNAFTRDEIKNACESAKSSIEKIHITKIIDFMTEQNLDTFVNYPLPEKKSILTDDLIYVNPKEWVETRFGISANPSETVEYTFPLKDEEYAYGGKKSRSKRMKKTRTKRKKTMKTKRTRRTRRQ